MTFDELLTQVCDLLQRQGRVSYRALKRRFNLDDDYLEDLKVEIIKAQRLAVDEDGEVLVWQPTLTPRPPQPARPPDTPAYETPQLALPVAGPQVPDAERRQLTVLFCDLVDSTRLARRFDPEDWRDIVRAYQQACAAVIQRFDGYIAQYLGDGLLVYFGYPQAHEDDAQRAGQAGLGMLEALEGLNSRVEQDYGIRLAVRVGMHTGPVVVGAMGGSGRQEQLAMGDTPNLAARLQGLASPDTVVVSAVTFGLLQGFFTCQALGTHSLKGVDEPVSVYQLLAASGAQTRLDAAAPRGLTPLVGREQEVGLLLQRWAQSTEGHGQVVLLSGEAGIGKSRLVEVLRERVGREGATWLAFRCSPYHTNSALHPVIDHLYRVLQFHKEDTPAERLDKLESALRSARLPLHEAVPLLATLLSVPLAERYPPLCWSSQKQKQKTQEALVGWLVAEAERQPVLAVWEDLHWADPSTLELLHLVIDQTPTVPLCTLLTSRPEFLPPWPSRSHYTQLTLSRFIRPQVEAMVLRVAGGKALPAEVVQQIVAKTDGVPLFVEELTKMVLESGLLREGEDHYDLTAPLPPLAIPTTLHDALMARLDRLGAAREIVQLAATLGREFAYDVLQAVSQLDEAVLQHALAQLVDAELLYQRGVPPQARYVFKHALIRDTAYQALLRSTRQQYHQRIAQVLETQFPETAETQPELLAHHFSQGEVWDKAVTYLRQAGEKAMVRSAHREAVGCFEQALSALPHLPETRATRELAIDLRLALRAALDPAVDFERTLAYLREAEAIAVALDDPHRLAEVSVALSRHFSFMGMYDQAIATVQRALTLATDSGDIVLHALVNQRLGVAYLHQGDYRRAIDCFRQSAESLDGARRRERFGSIAVPAVMSRTWTAWCHAELGTFAEGTALGDEGLRVAEVVNHPASLLVALWGSGLLALRQGDLPRALVMLERAMGICQDTGLPTFFSRLAAALGSAYALAGRVADAVALLPQTTEQTMATELVEFQALYRLSMGEAHMLAGRLEAAHNLAEGAMALTRRHQERGNEAYTLRLLGEIAARREPPEIELAEDHYQKALTLAEELGMRPLQAHCHLGLGTLYAKSGRPEQAHPELSAAMELYRAMEMTFWLPQAEAAMVQVT